MTLDFIFEVIAPMELIINSTLFVHGVTSDRRRDMKYEDEWM